MDLSLHTRKSLTPEPGLLYENSFLDPLSLIEKEDDEVSFQLNIIHREYDKIKLNNLKKRNLIQKLQKEINYYKSSSTVINNEKFNLDSRVLSLENHLDHVLNKRKEEEAFVKSYHYLLDRIKEDKLALDKELIQKQEDLSQKKHNLNSELSKSKKLYEKALKNKLEIRSLYRIVEDEKKLQSQSLLVIEKKANERSRAVARLQESNAQREHILEVAQGQMTNSEAIDLRQRLHLCQLWYHYLNKKLQKELTKGKILEEPFQMIRLTTGMQNVEDILTRFLTREEAYKDLVAAVKTSESVLNALKSNVKEAKNRLKNLKVTLGVDIVHVDEELIRNEEKSLTNFTELAHKYKVLLQSLRDWASRLLNSMSISTEVGNSISLLYSLSKECEIIMQRVSANAEMHNKALHDVVFLPSHSLIKQKTFSKLFKSNRRISPRKSSADSNPSLLIGL